MTLRCWLSPRVWGLGVIVWANGRRCAVEVTVGPVMVLAEGGGR